MTKVRRLWRGPKNFGPERRAAMTFEALLMNVIGGIIANVICFVANCIWRKIR